MRGVHQPMDVGGVGDEWVWIVWRGRWNDGDCDVGLDNEVVAHTPPRSQTELRIGRYAGRGSAVVMSAR